jgi:nucleoside-diphosphate-sugar epimerase
VLILGGTRFVGPHVVGELLDAGHDVTVFHRGETENALTTGAHHVHGDLVDFERYLSELRSLEPEVVVDLRAFRREEGRRVLGFRGVARRGVVASSADVYRAFGRLHRTEAGPPDPVPLTEESPLREVVISEDYDKVGVEEEAQADPDFPVTVLRLPAIHGPGDYQHRLYKYVKRMDDERPAILLDAAIAGWRWVRGYVEDVAHAIALAAGDDRAAGRVYNVADPKALTEEEWVRRLARVIGWAGEIVAAPTPELPPALQQADKFDLRQHFAVDSSRIRSELGYSEGADLNEALGRTIDWERANPPETLDPAEWDYPAEDAVLARLASERVTDHASGRDL